MNKKILFVSSNSTSIRSFLQKQIFELSKKNEIYILTKNSKEFSEFINKLDLNITIKNIPIRREINIFYDMLCFIYILLLSSSPIDNAFQSGNSSKIFNIAFSNISYPFE